jgi:dCTP deaminase
MARTTEGDAQQWLKAQLQGEGYDLTAVEIYQRKVARPFSGALGDAEMIAARKSGQIVIEPYSSELLNSSSYDVRLGGYFYRAERVGHRVDFSPYDEGEVRDYYAGPYKAMRHKDWCSRNQRQPFHGIGEDEHIIVLAPGECILGHTVEYIGARYGATTMMKARSSLGRINISACDDAGWGDVGYINRWTMEIRNKNKDVWVPLVAGMPIGQIVFFWVAGATVDYGEQGHYQGDKDLRKVKKSWKPEGMLPQIYSKKNRDLRRQLSTSPKEIF